MCFLIHEEIIMNTEIIIATVSGGLFVLAGNWIVSWHQQKLQKSQFSNEQKRLSLEWERQEIRRKEERNFELKKTAYYNYLALIRQSSRIPAKPMEIISALALLELCGSEDVGKAASAHALLIRQYIEKGIDPNTVSEVLHSADELSAAMLADFRSHTQS